MSRLKLRCGGREFEVDAGREGGELLLRHSDGTEQRFPLRRVGGAEFLVADTIEPETVHTLYAIRSGNHWWIHLDGRTWHLEALRERTSRTRPSGGLEAPTPATVEEVLVHDGDRVKAGQVLIVLSAMKMHIEIRAPHAGVVNNLAHGPGDQVDGGVTLLSVEPDVSAE